MEIEPATLLQAIVALESVIIALLAEPAINA